MARGVDVDGEIAAFRASSARSSGEPNRGVDLWWRSGIPAYCDRAADACAASKAIGMGWTAQTLRRVSSGRAAIFFQVVDEPCVPALEMSLSGSVFTRQGEVGTGLMGGPVGADKEDPEPYETTARDQRE